MDPITHVLTGLAMSRAGLSRWHARAPLLLMMAAEAPDIDVVSAFGGPFNYFVYHRWITHAVVFAPVLALVIALLFCAIDRSWRSFLAGFLLALAGVASHLLLDWTNAYGIRLLLPFNSNWYALNVTNVIDIWIWLVLGIATFGPLIGRLVSSEMGARPAPGRGMAIFALLFLLSYNVGRGFLHERAMATLDSRIYDGAAPLRVGAFPTLFNPLLWEGVVNEPAAMRSYRFNLAATFDPDAGKRFDKPAPSPAMKAAAKTYVFQRFL